MVLLKEFGADDGRGLVDTKPKGAVLLRMNGEKTVDCVLPDHLDDLWQQVVPAGGRHLVVRSGVMVVGNQRRGSKWMA